MKFAYRYQDRVEGIREGVVSASSKADAYAVLRTNGIRPIDVWPLPGLVNRLSGIGKRGLAIVVLGIVSATLAVMVLRSPDIPQTPSTVLRLPSPLPRQQIPDEPVAELVFSNACDRFLARFAVPGREVVVTARPTDGELAQAVKAPVEVSPSDAQPVKTLKRVVSSLKREAAVALASGDSADEFIEFLCERQRMEAAYRSEVVQRCKTGKTSLAAANALLRAAGLAEMAAAEESASENYFSKRP